MTRLRALVFGLYANAYHSYYDAGLHLIRPQPYERNVGHIASWRHVAATAAADDDDDDE